MKQKELDRLARLAQETYGRAPVISAQKATAILSAGNLPRMGCERKAADTRYGALWIQNHSGEYRVECYRPLPVFDRFEN